MNGTNLMYQLDFVDLDMPPSTFLTLLFSMLATVAAMFRCLTVHVSVRSKQRSPFVGAHPPERVSRFDEEQHLSVNNSNCADMPNSIRG